MNIRVHIERLILDGVPVEYGQRPQLRAAVEAELARLLIEDGIGHGPQEGGAYAYARGEAIDLTSKDTPAQWGQKIGRAVYGGISR